ncbi:hypothetical protein E9549_04045 [Blastococcus sp. MG754426]|uniref:hypothetical protein n=1 Tax=unclassified Blastococcus TaxID=2619396 RepID=UPI001EF0ADAC|nr:MULTISPECIES: hypothetical protein [unclassified Blastococcus]MCF6506583.1 hypothetical protein [Blastococcus sp. MG754426]MCF6510293.1 hypothetical protein [Blastococcus sp. MG754427]
MVEAALDILGASRRPEDRAAVFDLANQQNYSKRGGVLARLSDPIEAEEARRIVEAIADMRGRGAERTDWEPVARLLRRIPAEVATEFLAEPFRHGTGRQTLLEAGLVTSLGAERLREVLTGLTEPAVAEELLQRAASELPQDDVAAFSAWAHDRYPAAACAGFRVRLARGLQSAHLRGEERRRQALDGLWASALAGHDADAIADELVAASGTADLVERAVDVDSDRAARQLGAVAAGMLAVDPRTADEARVGQLVADTARAARALSPHLAPHYFAGLVRAATGTPAMTMLHGDLLDAVLEDGDTIAAFAAEGGLTVLTAHAARTPDHAAAVLLAARAHLSAEDANALLGIHTGRQERRRPSDPQTETPPAGVDWTTSDRETYLQILEVANAWPEAVFGVLSRALAALDEPEARHPTAEVLRALLAHAEAHALADHLGQDTTGHIRRLLTKQRDPEVLRATYRWIRRLDLDADGADLGRAQLVLAADISRGDRDPDLRALRMELAERHAQLAQNLALDTEQRIAYLRTAADLDAASARAAAVLLASSPTTEIRLAAAGVLAETAGSPDEHGTLADLVAAEDHAEVAELLQAALHRLASGDAGEALRNLAELLDLPTTGLDPDVLIPDPTHRDRFAKWVDMARARSANSHDPGAFIEAAINVADQMVDLAVIAAHDAGQPVALKTAQVDALRSNTANRPEAGALVTQQQRLQLFPWFQTVAALRQKRAAHPSRIGTTAPPHFVPDDVVVARGLLRDITAGWIEDMHKHAQEGGPVRDDRAAGAAAPG